MIRKKLMPMLPRIVDIFFLICLGMLFIYFLILLGIYNSRANAWGAVLSGPLFLEKFFTAAFWILILFTPIYILLDIREILIKNGKHENQERMQE